MNKIIARDNTQLIKIKQDKVKLFAAFAQLYNQYDAKSVFLWAAKYIKFNEPWSGKSLAKGPLWIKDT